MDLQHPILALNGGEGSDTGLPNLNSISNADKIKEDKIGRACSMYKMRNTKF